MSDVEQPGGKSNPAPYISPITFMNSVELLKPMPPKIDKSVFGTQAGGIQAKIISSFRFLNLIDDNNVPQPILRELATTEKDNRGPVLLKMLEGAYPFLTDPEFDLAITTTHALEERFRALNVSGATVRKAMSFFATLAKDAGLQISPHVKATRAGTTPSVGNGEKKKPRRKDPVIPVGETLTPPPTPPAPAEQDFWLKALERLPVFDVNMDENQTDRYVKVLETIVSAKAQLGQSSAPVAKTKPHTGQTVSTEQPGNGNDVEGED